MLDQAVQRELGLIIHVDLHRLRTQRLGTLRSPLARTVAALEPRRRCMQPHSSCTQCKQPCTGYPLQRTNCQDETPHYAPPPAQHTVLPRPAITSSKPTPQPAQSATGTCTHKGAAAQPMAACPAGGTSTVLARSRQAPASRSCVHSCYFRLYAGNCQLSGSQAT